MPVSISTVFEPVVPSKQYTDSEIVCIGGVVVFASCVFPDQGGARPTRLQLVVSLVLMITLAGLLPSILVHMASLSLSRSVITGDAESGSAPLHEHQAVVELISQFSSLHLLYPWLTVIVSGVVVFYADAFLILMYPCATSRAVCHHGARCMYVLPNSAIHPSD